MSGSVDIVRQLYSLVLKREPNEKELAYWVDRCRDMEAVPGVMTAFFESDEYKRASGVVPGHLPGHFYSPIHDPAQISRDRLNHAKKVTKTVAGIDLRLPEQRELWNEMTLSPSKLVGSKIPERRYFFDNPVYGCGDAFILSGMIAKLRPRRVIEIGSGFSSACMLDAVDDGDFEAHFTFIEPHPDALMWHLSEKDREACRIIVSPVQNVDPATFDALKTGDLLFIDSTHVMKSGSDVNCELFDILPRLVPGVIVHFHDVFWPFEYPADWLIDRRYAWNELYGLRAFLMYNDRFLIRFFNDAFSVLCADAVEAAPDIPRRLFTRNPGGGLWLEIR